ncbi:GNAT family N-acetyltransferase [Emticicia sp.]|uniref:GNAT family N-acetyltransferase n=1 Tax=Emticicia sp. TaxID=1930953 RepID=UPI003752B75A
MIVEITDTSISLRPIQAEDLMILSEIYSSTREKELKQVVEWNDEQKKAFVLQQFMAQHEYYQKNYIGAAFYVIQKNKDSIGRLYIHENFQEKGVRIIDIALLSQWQNRGIGSSILKDILAKASTLNRAVSIHVETFNPAMKLYKKLDFEKISETNGVYHLLEWKHKN